MEKIELSNGSSVRMMIDGLDAMEMRRSVLLLSLSGSWVGRRMFVTMEGFSISKINVMSCSFRKVVQDGRIMMICG